MRLKDIVIEASKTSDYPRLNARAAETVVRAIAEWFEQQDHEHRGCGGPDYLRSAKVLRDAL